MGSDMYSLELRGGVGFEKDPLPRNVVQVSKETQTPSADQVGGELETDWRQRAEDAQRDLEAWKQLAFNQQKSREGVDKQVSLLAEIVREQESEIKQLRDQRDHWQDQACGYEVTLHAFLEEMEPLMHKIEQERQRRKSNKHDA